ncbi:hypothetical protein MRX96_009950 [Rhipicephalus microplus]
MHCRDTLVKERQAHEPQSTVAAVEQRRETPATPKNAARHHKRTRVGSTTEAEPPPHRCRAEKDPQTRAGGPLLSRRQQCIPASRRRQSRRTSVSENRVGINKGNRRKRRHCSLPVTCTGAPSTLLREVISNVADNGPPSRTGAAPTAPGINNTRRWQVDKSDIGRR